MKKNLPALAAVMAFICTCPITAYAEEAETTGIWKEESGSVYWYEDDVKQGTEGRGKEIYDPDSDAWYWLDAEQGGAKAVSKDVYQESYAGRYADCDDGTGKWVRYDDEGKMVKGWDSTDSGTYYFDLETGTMAKGYTTVDGQEYYFNTTTGILESEGHEVPEYGWATMDGQEYWYEDYYREGYSLRESYRGKEIYDPDSDAWYWLDNVQGGAKAVSKDVYQESEAGEWAECDDGTGKWVRYDENGHMIKGWQTNDEGTYFFDYTFGTMAKGNVTIDGVEYCFDETTGILQENAVDTSDSVDTDKSEAGTDDEDTSDTVLSYEEQVVELVNEERAKTGLSPLSIDTSVQAAAQVRVQECEQLFSHTRPDGSSCFTALSEQNVSYRTAGENIAMGQSSPEEVVNAWMNSDGHRANILSEKYTSIGVGYYQNENGINYWLQLFIG